MDRASRNIKIYGLPRENLILYLRVPPREAQRLCRTEVRAQLYVRAKKDLQGGQPCTIWKDCRRNVRLAFSRSTPLGYDSMF